MRCAEKVAGAYNLGHKAGYEEGLDAAREAIAALVTERELRSPSGLEVDIHDALAAIDALKEEQ